jgi:cobyrinic acid a,c-diamide synthase
VRRGAGAWKRRDGIICGNVFAAYTHVHALATPQWITGVAHAARKFRSAAPAVNAASAF